MTLLKFIAFLARLAVSWVDPASFHVLRNLPTGSFNLSDTLTTLHTLYMYNRNILYNRILLLRYTVA